MRRFAWFVALGIVIGTAPARADEERGLDLYFIDVAGGAATLIVSPEGESVLIDSGWSTPEDRDPKRIEHVLREVAKLDHIDHLVTTHWHRDHFGGVEGLAKRVRVDHFWDHGLPSDEIPDIEFHGVPRMDDPLMVAYVKASEGKRQILKPGDALPLRGSLKARVLAAGGQVVTTGGDGAPNPLCESAPPDQPEDRTPNSLSIALLFSFGPFGFLDAGDLTWNKEKLLVCPENLIGQVDLYQVTHHGRYTSNHPTLIESINPVVSIMNNGPTKAGDPDVIERLKRMPMIEVNYQLHANAKLSAEENTPAEWIANKDPEGGQFYHVHVPPDGKTFTVQVGTEGKAREFRTR